MGKYYKAEDVLAIFSEEERPLNWTDSEAEIQADNDFDYYKGMIESLPPIEVSENCVSKRYLLAEIDDLADEFSEVDENGLHSERWCGIMDSKGVIKNAPSAVPTEKMGKWVKVSGYVTPGGDPVWECSECGKGRHVYGIEASSYQRDVSDQQWVACPNCGAKMRLE